MNDTLEGKEENQVSETEVSEESLDLNLADLMDSFVHKTLDIEFCAKEFIKLAQDNHNENAKRLSSEMDAASELLKDDSEEQEKVVGVKSIRKTIKEINRHNKSDIASTLEKSLFTNLFSILDKYVGDLIFILYNKKPELFNSMNREVCLSEVLQYSSIEELRNVVLDKEIETLRRKSYLEQFKEMEKLFSITLTKFDQWPKFIENAQRRNLFTHCDGVVSDQYLSICRQVGFKVKDDCKVGDQLSIGTEYFYTACSRITEVAVMLGQTLWRKLIPEELEEADNQLHRLIFEFLEMEHWHNALSLSKFFMSLPKISSDQIDRINTVNYAIALRAVGKKESSISILDKKDWSATTHDFRLAYAVLTDDYDDAKSHMLKIGKSGELLDEFSYHDWPLFRDFRDSNQFASGYEEIYGYKYVEKLGAIAEEKKKQIEDSELEEGSQC